jgi:hypothetical protein
MDSKKGYLTNEYLNDFLNMILLYLHIKTFDDSYIKIPKQ